MRPVILPGASLMEITPLENGVRVRCPGCESTQDYHGKGYREFRHGKACPVFALIEQAMALYERDEVKRG